jgi:preprotein translocase subunit YajC
VVQGGLIGPNGRVSFNYRRLFVVEFLTGFAANPEGQGGNPLTQMLIFFVPIILIMYFFMIRPQKKKQRDHQLMMASLKNGDKVITNSGIIGTIAGIHDDQNKVVLKVADQVKMEFVKSSIAGLMEKQ